MDVFSFMLIFAVTLIFMLIGLKAKIPLFQIFSFLIGFFGLVILVTDGSLTIPIEVCSASCQTKHIILDNMGAVIVLMVTTILSIAIFFMEVMRK